MPRKIGNLSQQNLEKSIEMSPEAAQLWLFEVNPTVAENRYSQKACYDKRKSSRWLRIDGCGHIGTNVRNRLIDKHY